MIFDHLANAGTYAACHPLLPAALDFLRTADLSGLPEGRIDLQPGLYVLIQEKTTKSPAEMKWEAHEKFLDIQLLIKGREKYGFALREKMSCTVPYDPAKDVAFFAGTGSEITLEEGEFCIFFPQDVHQPLLTPGEEPVAIKKAVVKIILSC